MSSFMKEYIEAYRNMECPCGKPHLVALTALLLTHKVMIIHFLYLSGMPMAACRSFCGTSG